MVFDLHRNYQVRILRTSWSQSKGLMFERPAGKAVVFEFRKPRRALFHMWFVFGAIDLLELDEARRVLAIKREFRPWSTYFLRHKAKYVVELPAGSVQAWRISRGEKLGW